MDVSSKEVLFGVWESEETEGEEWGKHIAIFHLNKNGYFVEKLVFTEYDETVIIRGKFEYTESDLILNIEEYSNPDRTYIEKENRTIKYSLEVKGDTLKLYDKKKKWQVRFTKR